MTRTLRIVIPDRHLCRLAAIARTDPLRGMVALWRVVLRQVGESWERADTVDASGYAIPSDQWHAMCRAFIDGSHGDVHGGLLMMNSGPSSWERVAS